MHSIVCPLNPSGDVVDHEGHIRLISDKEARNCLKKYYLDVDAAKHAAEEFAKQFPTVQFAVFTAVAVYETLPPVAPPVIRKRVTEQGEIVLDKGEAQ